jgi:large subunit ribosomal protein L9
MEVILLEKVGRLGNLGDKVTVKAGFGRNFLLPYGKAVPANEKNLQEFEARRAEFEAAAAERKAAAQAKAASLENIVLTITANASEDGRLFGSIGPREVANAAVDAGVELSKINVAMPEGAIRDIGEYDIDIRFESDVSTSVKLIIVAG